ATLPDYTSHYFLAGRDTSPCMASVEDASLDASGVPYKRVYNIVLRYCETYSSTYGFFLARNVMLGGLFGLDGYIGAYHAHKSTSANVDVAIAPPTCFDTTSACPSYIRLNISMSTLGITNGGVGRWSGLLLATDPPSYSFRPANPSVAYASVSQLRTARVNILFGYDDYVSDTYAQWAATRKDMVYVVGSATPPPEIGVAWSRQLSQYEVLVATWDGEWRLWVRGKDKGLVVPLGRNTRVASSSPLQRANPSTYDRAGRALPAGREAVELIVETEHPNLYTKTKRWRAVVAIADDGSVWAALGDTAWDGDKIGYLFAYLPHDS
ncbi:hypothetical protein, partial [Pyrobaculum sp.]|uniref:hypothetical protein n=1 Tax=Pyrobaculum sp. TaxID=2004705 RepID=UPI003D0B3827